MKKSFLSARKKSLVLAAGVILSSVLGGLVLASNMGFKLNYGNVNAINKLLRGSGLSIAAETTEAGTAVLVVSIDDKGQSTQNSNMGFKLNVKAVPVEGVPIELEEGLEVASSAIEGPYMIQETP
jgi:hypothetical protein